MREVVDRPAVAVSSAWAELLRLDPWSRVRFDAAGGTIADVAAELRAPVLVVVRAGLGTLNEAALAGEALRARALACVGVGVVVGAWPAAPDLAARCNLEDLPAYAGAPLRGGCPPAPVAWTPRRSSRRPEPGSRPRWAARVLVDRSLLEVHA